MSKKISHKMEKMLEMDLGWMDKNLVAAIILQGGGEDAFFQNESSNTKSSCKPGFTTDDEVVGFLEKNKALLLEHISCEIEIEEVGSCIEFIKDLIPGRTPLTLDQVAEGLHDTNSAFRVTVARGIISFMTNLLVCAYEDAKEREKLKVVILDNGWPYITSKKSA